MLRFSLFHRRVLSELTIGKITDYITDNPACPIKDQYLSLDIGNNLDANNKYTDSKFGNGPESLGEKPIAEFVEWKRPTQFMKGSYAVF